MISTILFIAAAFFGAIWFAWMVQGVAMLNSGRFSKVTVPIWPLLICAVLVVAGVLV